MSNIYLSDEKNALCANVKTFILISKELFLLCFGWIHRQPICLVSLHKESQVKYAAVKYISSLKDYAMVQKADGEKKEMAGWWCLWGTMSRRFVRIKIRVSSSAFPSLFLPAEPKNVRMMLSIAVSLRLRYRFLFPRLV